MGFRALKAAYLKKQLGCCIAQLSSLCLLRRSGASQGPDPGLEAQGLKDSLSGWLSHECLSVLWLLRTGISMSGKVLVIVEPTVSVYVITIDPSLYVNTAINVLTGHELWTWGWVRCV